MIQSKLILQTDSPKKKRQRNNNNNNTNGNGIKQYKKLISMGKISIGLINELDSPIDSINRFINLALQTIGENSQSRQFLLESKQGIRKTSHLLKRLNNYAKKIEEEIEEIYIINGQRTDINSK